MEKKKQLHDASLENMEGPLEYTLINDCLFKFVLQKNEKILRSLLASLLHINEAEIESAIITNPIMSGDNVTDKTFILDTRIRLNNNSIINIEMQIIDYGNWPERSLGYLCRNFDNLNQGEDYIVTKPATHISILDFTLFKDSPEFYSIYHMTNQNNGRIYTDKFTIHVLDLTKIELATEEDKAYRLDYWAKIFKAKTWEELRMISNTYSDTKTVTEEIMTTIVDATSDEYIRWKCEARRDYLTHERVTKERLREQEQALKEQEQALKEQEHALNMKEAEINKLRQKLIDAGMNPDNI